MTPEQFRASFADYARLEQTARDYQHARAQAYRATHATLYAVPARPILWSRAVYWLHQFEAADIRDTFTAQVVRVWLEALITALEAQADAGNTAALDALYMRLMDARYGVAQEIDTKTIDEARRVFDNARMLADAYDDEQYATEADEAEKAWRDFEALAAQEAA